ncbi:MAG: response regulator transcription factor [Lachnospiraceae bacterium]|nr:response regulator transcription factor [Lachnospiraceae bacterium]
MRYKIAICDDDTKQRDYLREIVTSWAQKNRHLIDLKQYSHGEQFLFDYEEEKDFDILLLDIEMPGINGIDLAKQVRRDNTSVQMVFVTGFYDYFSDGFDVSALHYLIKPVSERKLFPVLDKAADNLAYRQRSVLLSTADADVKVSLADITYVEAENVYVMVHTVRGAYRTRMSLAKFNEQLDDTFLKVHRSYVVGLKYIKKITRTEITMLNGDTVPISRGMYDAVHTALVKYL